MLLQRDSIDFDFHQLLSVSEKPSTAALDPFDVLPSKTEERSADKIGRLQAASFFHNQRVSRTYRLLTGRWRAFV